MLFIMRYVLFMVLILTGCSSDMSLVPVDPMAEFCITTDFSHHTAQELSRCRAWLGARAGGYNATVQPRRADPSPTTYSLYSNGGKLQSLLSCSGTTCTEVPH